MGEPRTDQECGTDNPSFVADVEIREEIENVENENRINSQTDFQAHIFTQPSAPPLDSDNYQASAPNLNILEDKFGGEEKTETREKWGNQIEFLLSCVAMSVGLGNVWRFPFTAYANGGGAFLIPYMIVLLVIGRPMYYMEMCLGQFSSYGPVKVWEICPIFRGIGYASMIAASCTVSFYCSIMAVTLYYFYAAFSNPLPWSEKVCEVEENFTSMAAQNFFGICEDRLYSNRSFSEMYYFSTVFPQLANIENGIGSPHWKLAICLLISWIVIFIFLAKGIHSAGKLSYFTALFPYVVLIALLIRGITLPGAMDGIYYFIEPDWSKIMHAKVWFAAVSQCFFSLNVGFGTIIFLSSHNSFRHNVYRDAIVISITDTITSCLAGCVIFCLLGYLAHTMQVEISHVTKGGPALAFVAFPESIARLEYFSQVFAVLFFLMLFTLGSGSAVALAGQSITIIRDEFPNLTKWKVALVVCTLGFLSGIVYVTPGGQFVLTLVNHNGADFIIYITGTLEIIAVSWVYGVNRFCDDIKFMLGKETEGYWKIMWGFLMPVGLISLLVYFFSQYNGLTITHEGAKFPDRVIVYGWILSAVILSILPICAIKAVYQSTGDTWLEKFYQSLKPLPSWGPKSKNERNAWIEQKNLKEMMTMNTKVVKPNTSTDIEDSSDASTEQGVSVQVSSTEVKVESTE